MDLRIDWEEYSTDDFLKLDGELNEYYLHCGIKQSKRYLGYNTVDDITDFFIAYQGDEAVGICAFKPHTSLFGKRTAEIKRLFVRQEYRGLGIGGAIFQKTEEAVKRKGYSLAVLTTSSNCRNNAVEFYKKRGYTRMENFAPFEADEEVLCLKKEIK